MVVLQWFPLLGRFQQAVMNKAITKYLKNVKLGKNEAGLDYRPMLSATVAVMKMKMHNKNKNGSCECINAWFFSNSTPWHK